MNKLFDKIYIAGDIDFNKPPHTAIVNSKEVYREFRKVFLKYGIRHVNLYMFYAANCEEE